MFKPLQMQIRRHRRAPAAALSSLCQPLYQPLLLLCQPLSMPTSLHNASSMRLVALCWHLCTFRLGLRVQAQHVQVDLVTRLGLLCMLVVPSTPASTLKAHNETDHLPSTAPPQSTIPIGKPTHGHSKRRQEEHQRSDMVYV